MSVEWVCLRTTYVLVAAVVFFLVVVSDHITCTGCVAAVNSANGLLFEDNLFVDVSLPSCSIAATAFFAIILRVCIGPIFPLVSRSLGALNLFLKGHLLFHIELLFIVVHTFVVVL